MSDDLSPEVRAEIGRLSKALENSRVELGQAWDALSLEAKMSSAWRSRALDAEKAKAENAATALSAYTQAAEMEAALRSLLKVVPHYTDNLLRWHCVAGEWIDTKNSKCPACAARDLLEGKT